LRAAATGSADRTRGHLSGGKLSSMLFFISYCLVL
jgi:hypothetical protein